MNVQEFFGLLSVCLLLPQYILYVKDIYLGKTKPHMFSWIIWTLTATIVFFTQWSEGAGAGAWLSAGLAIACFLIFLSAFPVSDKIFTNQDLIFLALGLGTIPIWYYTNDPLWAVLLVIFIETCAFYLTGKKIYANPYSETLIFFVMYIPRSLLSILAMENMTFTTLAYPAFLALAGFSLTLFGLWRRHVLKYKSQMTIHMQ